MYKVLIITIWYPDIENPHNGVFVEEQAKALSRYCDVKVLHINNHSKRNLRIRIIQEKRNNIAVIRANHPTMKIPLISFILFNIAAIKAFRTIMKTGFKPDILHAHVFNAGMPAVLLGKWFKIPVIMTEHSNQVLCKNMDIRTKIRLHFAMSGANTLIAVSEHLKEKIQELVTNKSIQVIPNLVDSHYGTTRKNLTGNRLICVGGYIRQKGIDILLKSLHNLKRRGIPFYLELIGGGDASIYIQMSKKLNIFENITFSGPIAHDEVLSKMASSTLFILPTREETFGVVFIEAMAAGLPVIGSDISPINKIIPHFAGKLVAPGDVDGFSDAIIDILENLNRYQPKMISGYAIERFGADKVCLEIMKVYKDVLRCRNGWNK